jgi:hypothetical protein
LEDCRLRLMMKIFVCTFLLLTSSAFGSRLAAPEEASIVEEAVVSVQNIHHHSIICRIMAY